jgi:alpha-tubulin suppressor-like RCC1 family protein
MRGAQCRCTCSLQRVQRLWARTLLLVIVVALALAGRAVADQSSQPSAPPAGHLTSGQAHSCAVLAAGTRCWGFGGDGRLGLGSTASIGDDETPGSAGPVDFGPGAVVDAITAGTGHTCALLSDGTVHCWGFGVNGRLGYANTNNIGDDEPAASAGAVQLGGPAKAITAGEAHTCALLVDGSVRCWGYGGDGQLGYSKPPDPPTGSVPPPSIGDDETPASAGPVSLGGPAIAITAGGAHTCALMAAGTVRCWGYGALGALGYGNRDSIGDNETPDTVGPVDLGGHTATAIDAGESHTCAVLDDSSVRCWGNGLDGELGLGNTNSVGDVQTPAAVPSVDLGAGATVRAISAGRQHTCALLDDGTVRCWGRNQLGQLGYGRIDSIGDDEAPASAGAVALGPGRTAVAVAAGFAQTCALLDDQSVRCWGYGASGRLGYCNETTIGDDELPSAAGPVDFSTTGAGCVVQAGESPAGAPPAPDPGTPAGAAVPAQPSPPDPRAIETQRRRALNSCLRTAAQRPRRLRTQARNACLRRHGRTPGRVGTLHARVVSPTKIVISFTAAGSDGQKDPAARAYVIKQSARAKRIGGGFLPATSLCRVTCRFKLTNVGTRVSLTVTDLQPRTTYSYSVAARDNVSNRLGPRVTVRVRTR